MKSCKKTNTVNTETYHIKLSTDEAKMLQALALRGGTWTDEGMGLFLRNLYHCNKINDFPNAADYYTARTLGNDGYLQWEKGIL